MKELAIDNETLMREVRWFLREGKRVKLRAKGDSMRPFILSGDSILIIPETTYRKGDVVLAHAEDGRYVVHRIIGYTDSGFILMGDGNLYGKEHCLKNNVFGRVGEVIHGGRKTNLLTKGQQIKAYCWHFLLPLRRLRQRILR